MQIIIAERYIAGRSSVLKVFQVLRLLTVEQLIDMEEEQNNIKYEKLQRQAIATALSRGIMIMTGGPEQEKQLLSTL